MSDAAAAVAAALARGNYFIFVTQVHFCAMYAVSVWDWLTSIRQEHRFIWKSRWTLVKALYLFARYYVLFTVPYVLWCFCVQHSWDFCQRAYRSPVAIALWNMVAAESVLIIRTYAFFERDKRILIFLGSTLTGIVVYQLWVTADKMLPLPFLGTETGYCFPMSLPGEAHILGFFVAPLGFDTLMTTITLARALFIRKRNGPSSRIIQLFLREGLFYYILISAANLVNGIFYFQPHAEMSAIMIPLSVILAPVLACRLILDIRQRAEERVGLSSSSGARRAPQFRAQMGSGGNAGQTDLGGNTAGMVSLGNADPAIELQSISGKDYKDDMAAYRSVEVPMHPAHGIRVDIEKGMIVR